MATKKAPRRTAQRILEVCLVLFNRFGEPSVSTNAISAELNISPGNLYYHYPAKDDLVNALLAQFEDVLHPILQAADGVNDVEDAWFFLHTLFETQWQYRFIYRNLNELLSRNRHVEARMREVNNETTAAMQYLLKRLQHQQVLTSAPPRDDWSMLATSMVVVLTYWPSYEYVGNPRQAMEDENAQSTALRGASHVLSLLAPYVDSHQRVHLERLICAYSSNTANKETPEQAASIHTA